MDQHYTLSENEKFNNYILVKAEDEGSIVVKFNVSDISQISISKTVEMETLSHQTLEHQTPHTTRTLHSMSDELFSPGSFFASRSGQLGDLEAKDQTSRPTWYTPKHDPQGRLIDPIEITPNYRVEKVFLSFNLNAI